MGEFIGWLLGELAVGEFVGWLLGELVVGEFVGSLLGKLFVGEFVGWLLGAIDGFLCVCGCHGGRVEEPFHAGSAYLSPVCTITACRMAPVEHCCMAGIGQCTIPPSDGRRKRITRMMGNDVYYSVPQRFLVLLFFFGLGAVLILSQRPQYIKKRDFMRRVQYDSSGLLL